MKEYMSEEEIQSLLNSTMTDIAKSFATARLLSRLLSTGHYSGVHLQKMLISMNGSQVVIEPFTSRTEPQPTETSEPSPKTTSTMKT